MASCRRSRFVVSAGMPATRSRQQCCSSSSMLRRTKAGSTSGQFFACVPGEMVDGSALSAATLAASVARILASSVSAGGCAGPNSGPQKSVHAPTISGSSSTRVPSGHVLSRRLSHCTLMLCRPEPRSRSLFLTYVPNMTYGSTPPSSTIHATTNSQPRPPLRKLGSPMLTSMACRPSGLPYSR